MSQLDQARFDAEPPKRGWFRRNWLWFVPTIILLPIFLCGGCFATIFYAVVSGIKGSGAYQTALERVQQSPEVQAAIGQPITDTTVFPTGNIQTTNNEGTAKLLFSVAGPNGTANVDLNAILVDGTWHYEKLDVTCSDGSTIDLSDEPVVLEGDAPVFGDEAPEAEEAPAEDERPKRPAPELNIDIEE